MDWFPLSSSSSSFILTVDVTFTLRVFVLLAVSLQSRINLHLSLTLRSPPSSSIHPYINPVHFLLHQPWSHSKSCSVKNTSLKNLTLPFSLIFKSFEWVSVNDCCMNHQMLRTGSPATLNSIISVKNTHFFHFYFCSSFRTIWFSFWTVSFSILSFRTVWISNLRPRFSSYSTLYQKEVSLLQLSNPLISHHLRICVVPLFFLTKWNYWVKEMKIVFILIGMSEMTKFLFILFNVLYRKSWKVTLSMWRTEWMEWMCVNFFIGWRVETGPWLRESFSQRMRCFKSV